MNHPKMIIDGNKLTSKHPLTYEIANEIYPHDPNGHEYYCGDWHQHMQAGANWQLEQCLAWLQANLMENDFQKGYTYLYDPELEFKFEVDKVVENLRAAMRPQEEQ